MRIVPEFVGFPKIARLSRECTITEKLDGTNGCIYIEEFSGPMILYHGKGLALWAGSKSRWLTPKEDNFGFAKWALEHAEELLRLGPGRHFGEWWGCGIQRGYGLKEKRFSLFNTARWSDDSVRPSCCHVVPVLYQGVFSTHEVQGCLGTLILHGSVASPGFMNPEGVVVYHSAANICFKKTIRGDDKPKGRGDE